MTRSADRNAVVLIEFALGIDGDGHDVVDLDRSLDAVWTAHLALPAVASEHVAT